MADKKSFFRPLNFFADCREQHLGIMECPSFLFILMGLINIGAMLGVYFLIKNFRVEPEIIALAVSFVSAVILIIGYIVVNAFSKLAEVSRLKSEFVSIASHQLRTPLTTLKYSLGLLLSGRIGQLNVKEEEQLDMIKGANQRMIDLVNNLLNVSRIEQGRLIIQKEPISLFDLTQEVVRELSSFAVANNVTLIFNYEPNLPKVLGDAARTKMVIHNMTDNAIKFSRKKSQVTISLERLGNYLRWQVKDEGIGIPKTEQKQIFQKFFRAQNITRYQTRGSGLGLYIAKAMIEASDGKVGFLSEEGRGSTFWFTLPIVK